MGVAVAKRAGAGPGRTSQHRAWGWFIDKLGSRGWILLVLFLLLLVAASIVPDVFAPYDHEAQSLRFRLLGPGESSPEGVHLLGTDSLGRDLFSRMVVGARLTLFIAVTATLIGAAVGVLFGLLGGYFGGRTDRLLMRLGEAQTAMPMFLVAILLLSLLGPSVLILIVVLPCLVWPIFARVVRAEALRLREETFIEASVATGCSTATILGRHLLPNVAPRILVLCVVEIGHVMLSEAGLSFLGVGVQPPDTTWGLLISEGRPLLAVAWWLTILPGVLLGVSVLVLNLLGRYWEARSGAAG
ncbi:MAG: ABC transporter permease [Acidimicrobiaceae bacterium]|nr:ABC transporter permease [Acidimicrobiaceae bacterium]MYH44032.1 ABC transporter permease [Acidimicrobiaceae bacterium]MYI54833.1 ABC transporter permease [Acidimicrobiaceae bacterium]MYJ42026.1 ABC transporter permease [Acidimicrobiaceae bacterium]MYK72971.1 ABC transporter permease [Acidimicrobiaceae bacterium]